MIGAAQGCGICHKFDINVFGSTFFESAFKIRSVVKCFIYLKSFPADNSDLVVLLMEEEQGKCASPGAEGGQSLQDEEVKKETLTDEEVKRETLTDEEVKRETLTDEEVKSGTLIDEEATFAEEEEDEDALPHSEILDIFEEGLARLVQDPLLCDLPIQVTLEEVNSQIALEYGQAMTVNVVKANSEIMPIVVVQNATVLDLKKAISRFIELKQQREGGIKHISWKYIWRTYHLIFQSEKLEDDTMKLKNYGIRNRDEVTFMKKLRKK